MTAPQSALSSTSLREDVLVSVCFGHVPPDAVGFDAVSALAKDLDARFRFREIIVVADESRRDDYTALLQRVDNLRLFTVRDGTGFYRRRVIAADEAIGDVVLMTNVAELAYLDFVAMIERAAADQQAVLAVRAVGVINRSLAAPLVALGRMSGFEVGLRDLQTLAVPRTLLNQLLAHPAPDLALRFPPRDIRLPLVFATAPSDMPVLREAGQQQRRLALLQKLLVYVAPSLLMIVTLTSALLAAVGLFYAFYVLAVWVVVDDIASGWLTLSAMLSATAFFLGVSIMGMSLGLQQLLARAEHNDFDSVATETNRIDLFGKVASELNVDLERDHAEPQEVRRL